MVRTYLAIFVVGMAMGCSHCSFPAPVDRAVSQPPAQSAVTTSSGPTRLLAKHLPNAVRIHPKVISGGLPEGDAAFQELAELGVRTIISVDGAKPDAEMAARHGVRYVHLPHGYDGIPEERAKQLAKAVRDLDGPIYIHCHHGKHRSPAAASVACVTAGLIPPSESITVLEFAGTSPAYLGLYQSAAKAHPLDETLLDELDVEFRDTVEVPPLAEAMVALEHTYDDLNEIAKAGWRVPVSHPDLEPAHEALLLQEHFKELMRTTEAQQQAAEFRQCARDSEAAAHELASRLGDWNAVESGSNPPEIFGRLAVRISNNCNACHRKFRDAPLRENQ